MTLETQIEATLKSYLWAFYQQDFDTLLAFFDQEDLRQYRENLIMFAEQMDVFGETEDFLQKLNITDLTTLKKTSQADLIVAVFKLVTQSIGSKAAKKVVNETVITNIQVEGEVAEVTYQFPIKFFDEWEVTQGTLQMKQIIDYPWKILFKSGLDTGWKRFQDEINLYYERKSRDHLNSFRHEGDLTKFNLTGYNDFSTGNLVFEPRFRDSGDFSNGLAYVQIIRKYGYINTKGDIAIKPAYLEARDFSQKLAAVKVKTAKGKVKWGFINKKAETVIDHRFDDASKFSEGLCAVALKGKWGFINKKGEFIVKCQFDSVEDFSAGNAYAEKYSKDGSIKEFAIHKKGKIEKLS